MINKQILLQIALVLLSVGILSCTKEKFDTELNISFRSGIKKLSVLPCPIEIRRHVLEDNVLSTYNIIDTIYTDSFGNYSSFVRLAKPEKTEYYQLELFETKWMLPMSNNKIIKAGIKNDVVFDIKPKWRHNVTIIDSSGTLDCFLVVFSHSLSEPTYLQIEKIDSIPKFGAESFITSTPSLSFLIVDMQFTNRTTGEWVSKRFTYDSEKMEDIWIKY